MLSETSVYFYKTKTTGVTSQMITTCFSQHDYELGVQVVLLRDTRAQHTPNTVGLLTTTMTTNSRNLTSF
jgi:hypothetical protein